MTSEVRSILATNIRRMISATGREGAPVSVRAWALSKGLETRLIDRIVKGENAVTVDTLESIAASCGVTAWQLIHPDFTPEESVMPNATAEDIAFLKKLRKFIES
jgi:transcriptional regulator with XRE-family HTH domain